MAQQIENSTIGIDLLKMLMLQLYSNPRCIYREYIQNALDSINEAVQLGILKRVKDGHVGIQISSNNITIEDNGTGIPSDRAVKYLTDIANSIKNGVTSAGLYGVGRLSGGGYCDILEFDTSYQGEGVGTIVTMDTRILRKLLDENHNEMSAEEAMCQICTTQTYETEPEKHYFVVRLKNVINSADILLNTEDILQYIKEVAPVDYSVTFNSLINSSEQREFVEKHKAIDKIKVSLNETADIEKSYDLVVKGSGDNIEKIRYFELPAHEKFGKMGWGWYAVTDFSVQISDEKDPNAGIRLRKHNISLDKNILNAFFKEARGNKYFYGEIFISNNKIHPDSGRQGLAASEEADALIKTVKEYFGVLHLVYNKASRLKSKLKSIQDAVDNIKGKTDPAVINILIGKLKEVVKDFEKFATYDSHEEVNDVISIYKNKYAQNLQKEVQKLLREPEPSKKDVTPSVAQEPDDYKSESIAGETTTQTEHSPIDPNKNTEPTSSIHQPSGLTGSPTQQTKSSTGTENKNPISFTPPPPVINTIQKKPGNSGVDSLLQPLINKGIYTSEQLAVLRKVLNTMLLVCPSAKKKNLSVLMQSAIASLE
jgi:molecular chaperone HtpG